MSKIEWTEKTWNPIAGCTRVSEGCRHCYAESMAKRLAAMGQEKYEGLVDANGHWTGKISLDPEAHVEPLTRKKPTVYFVNSMSDLFHENVPSFVIGAIFGIMAATPHHQYQILTKRPEQMLHFFKVISSISKNCEPACCWQYALNLGLEDNIWPISKTWPLPNVWLGVSVENQEAANERIPLLLQTPAAIRFLSCEPLLGPIDLNSIPRLSRGVNGFPDPIGVFAEWQEEPCRAKLRNGVDWVIAGGESGPGARPMHPFWVRSLRDQCIESGTPFFFKQWGEYKPLNPHYVSDCISDKEHEDCENYNYDWDDPRLSILDTFGRDWNGEKAQDPPGTYFMYRMGKQKAGRELDGQIWDEMPEVQP